MRDLGDSFHGYTIDIGTEWHAGEEARCSSPSSTWPAPSTGCQDPPSRETLVTADGSRAKGTSDSLDDIIQSGSKYS